MERIEIPVDHEIETWLAAMERGDEVILVRDGTPVAQLCAAAGPGGGSLNLPALLQLRQAMRSSRVSNAGRLIRKARDASDH